MAVWRSPCFRRWFRSARGGTRARRVSRWKCGFGGNSRASSARLSSWSSARPIAGLNSIGSSTTASPARDASRRARATKRPAPSRHRARRAHPGYASSASISRALNSGCGTQLSAAAATLTLSRPRSASDVSSASRSASSCGVNVSITAKRVASERKLSTLAASRLSVPSGAIRLSAPGTESSSSALPVAGASTTT